MATKDTDNDKRQQLERDMKANPQKYFTGPEGHIRDKISIHEHESIPKEGLFVSLNGYAFLIQPGVEIDIPRPLRKMLDTCIERRTLQDGTGKPYTKDIPRVTYTLIKEDVASA